MWYAWICFVGNVEKNLKKVNRFVQVAAVMRTDRNNRCNKVRFRRDPFSRNLTECKRSLWPEK